MSIPPPAREEVRMNALLLNFEGIRVDMFLFFEID